MIQHKLSSIVLASVLAATQLTVHAQTPAGAGAATSSAVGGVSTNVIVATAFGVAAIASMSSGSSGSISAANVAVAEGAASSAAAATNAAAANTAVTNALSQLGTALTAAGLSSDPTISNALTQANLAAQAAVAAATVAAQAASDLAVASNVAIVGVVNGGRTICAAATTCTKNEILALSLNAAVTAQKATDASNYAILKSNELKAAVAAKDSNFNINAFTAALAEATAAAVKAQAAADEAEADHNTAAAALGATGTTIAATTGTTGTTGTSGTTGTTGTY